MLKLKKGSTKYTQVYAIDEKSFGGAYHVYDIVTNGIVDDNLITLSCIKFQKGPVKETEINGIFIEDLLRICEHRLECFQNTNFKCNENTQALIKIQEALMWLDARTKDRETRNVQGTSNI